MRTWGDASRCTFGREEKLVGQDRTLTAAPFLSPEHSMRMNMGLHSPGPGTYMTEETKRRKRGPRIDSGPADRFFKVDTSRIN